ncbi:hypothetical protein ACF0H5_017689 [Mactra antiquata]
MSARAASTASSRKLQNGAKTDRSVRTSSGGAAYRVSQFPKRTVHSANKKKVTVQVKKADDKSSSTSRDQKCDKTKTTKGSASVTVAQANKKETEAATNSGGKQSSPRKESIFITPTRDYTDISEDVIHADCFNHGYRVEKTVGEGAYAKVKLAEVLTSKLARNPSMCEHVDTEGNFKVAIKVIEARCVPREFLKKFLPRELENHCPLPVHKNVVRVFEQFKTADRYYVVMEYCSNGDLLDLINCRISESCKGLGEDKARSLFKMMAEGMNHIHANGIVHRDLKCENILLDKGNNIKITDFGFSCKFTPGETSLLKTSCGSYAYTAPEVIKLKPYDGTKSDVWSLGIILFAMLNGRLPFNDAQLTELEEDMKMQRLRFERNVSFESMVLVRRILQYNPSNRPTMAEILSDTWLTGKRLIPRQQTKPKWTNPYTPHPPVKQDNICKEPKSVHGSTVYYKSTVPEHGDEATVTVNHAKNETVTLKSRAGSKKNIWINGPKNNQRPNTWPRTDKSKTEKTTGRSAKSGPTKPKSRGTSAGNQQNRTVVVVKQAEPKKKPTPANNENKSARVSQKTIELTKWFLEKYMSGKEQGGSTDSKNCMCCKAESTKHKCELEEDDPDLCFLDNGDIMQALNSMNDDFRFPSPVKNVPTIPCAEAENTPAKTDQQTNRSKTNSPEPCGRKSMTAVRKSPTKATPIRHGAKSAKAGALRTTAVTTDFSRNTVVNYMVNRSTSPAERVKYFRDRLMKLYGNDKEVKQVDGTNGLPPLMVQSLNSPRGVSSTTSSAVTNDVTKTPASSSSYTPQAGAVSGRQTLVNAWRTGYKTVTTSSTSSTAGTTTTPDFTSSTEVYTSTSGDQGISSTTDLPTTDFLLFEDATESSNNTVWMIVGVVCGVIVVISILVIAIGVYAFHKSKRVHPHSDTESFCSESESQSGTRPTTASHIFIEPEEEEAMSKPVTMTPFELRKLYVETFPYKNWKKGYDGSLRPQMSLTFVDPKLYARSRGDEKNFREKIYNYENSDSLTLRSSALSRMMQHNVMPTMHEMDTVYEQPLPPIRGQPPTQNQLPPRTPRSESLKKSEDVELQ